MARGKFTRRKALVLVGGVVVFALAESRRLGTIFQSIQKAFNPPPMPPIISRAQWGALPPDHTAANELGITDDPNNSGWYVYTKPLQNVYNTVVIHHTAAPLSSSETMLDVQALHMQQNRWADIGYHFGIDKDGLIYEGRDIHVRGASVARHNTGVIGVVLMGDFEIDQPLDIQLSSLQTLVDWLANAYRLTHLAGHGEFVEGTLCPGKYMIPHLDALAAAADLQRGTGGYVAPPTEEL